MFSSPTKKQLLVEAFQLAIEANVQNQRRDVMMVKVKAFDSIEWIIIPNDFMEKKIAYYQAAYSDALTLVSNNNVSIVEHHFGPIIDLVKYIE
ncbi:hypothetical protein [Kurthia sp. Dielmo]|uniref:hypothetical protein n=1 Tax=Kurthia sp. Dielmo TaxID=1033738 RepID=UPI001124C1E4|nr:hypothetical protein [Kurthia sp. Dielmo]